MNTKPLLSDLKKIVIELADDLRDRVQNDGQIDAALRLVFQQVEKGKRTAQAFEIWREDYLDQVAVAWVLACVFVRFMEDNLLIDDCWLAGEGDRRKLTEDAHELFFREHPHDTDREYFHHVFHEVGKIPAAAELFAEGKTPLWAVAPSGDTAMKLLAFWREIDPETGDLKRNFLATDQHGKNTEKNASNSFPCFFRVDPWLNTRFLGDMYQDLSERARKKYALLQTPIFVEEFILDRTLNPAIDEFGLEEVRLIDPTCGSGHFLLGAFARLFRLWMMRENNEIVAAQKALDGVWGVDINPFAVEIARFRLIVAALQACGIQQLKHAPAWTIHLATGDSLLFGSKPGYGGERIRIDRQDELFEVPAIYAVEDRQAVREILDQDYHVVVGNPPYITVKDKALNEQYRKLYNTCHRQYSLAVPFTQRFWELARQEIKPRINTEETRKKTKKDSPSVFLPCSSVAGYVGMITANSFMKREFGKKLIEQFFPTLDLTQVIDTSGAYIPGHGTPTVILFGRHREPLGDTVRAVMGIKGEPTTPDDPANGLVWQSIVKQIDQAGTQDEFTSTADVTRAMFANHPWSIGGGGAADLKETIENDCERSLGEMIAEIGRSTHTGEDEVFYLDPAACYTKSLLDHAVPLIEGEGVRDYGVSYSLLSLLPYDKTTATPIEVTDQGFVSHFWRYRTTLKNRKDFGEFIEDRGLRWIDHSMFFPGRYRTPLSIAFAFVATHNHFVLDRGGKVFKQSAPIIKLPAEASEDDHLALLGLLNSSTACFWMKQSLHDKGGGGIGGGLATEFWEHFFEFTGTGLQRFPIPEQKPLALARQLDALGQEYRLLLPEAMVRLRTPSAADWERARTKAAAIRGRMIALQEELDWQCYGLYGLLSHGSTRKEHGKESSDNGSVFSFPCFFRVDPWLNLGERAFEIVMARRGEKTTWFERHGSTPIAELPQHWPAEYRQLVERRIQLIETNKEIGLIERPEYKRRWNAEPWEAQQQRALRNWLLDRLEEFSHGSTRKKHGKNQKTTLLPCSFRVDPWLITTAQLADRASVDADFMQVAALYRGRSDFDLVVLVAELIEAESVPFLPILRYKASGLRKREVWERVWEMQREEELATDEHGRNTKKDIFSTSVFLPCSSVAKIPVPPKYMSADFQKSDYWRLRGKLDVPKERWISYPHCSGESDPSLLVCWAGWNHLQQATALATYYDARKREGWDGKRLAPLLAGLDQLLPWIHQWHPEIDTEFGETAGKSYQTMLEQDAHELGLTLGDIRGWTAESKPRNTRKTRKKKGESS